MTKNQDPKQPKRSNLVQLSGVGVQMGVTIFLGAYFGQWLDEQYPADKKWFTMLFTILAVVIALYSVIKQLNRINGDDK